jgi:cellulose synthase/poly-beta-1,6-N-acetylglucosamine synthase-like glycosyltransferase
VISAAFILYGLVSVILFTVVGSTLVWMLDHWRMPAGPNPIEALDLEPCLSFSLLVPARHEQQVLGATLSRLALLDHPRFEVVVVIGQDDPGTRAVAEQAVIASRGRVRIVVDDSWPKMKPKALNAGLAACTGEIVGIFDAEDEVALDLLRRVDEKFVESHADVVQAGVQLVNLHSRWFSLRNCLEYFFWYRSRMNAHARHGVMPLGGNTVFIRRDLLSQLGGWDPECLAEDCELGIRLSAAGARTAVMYDAHLATREETPDTLKALVRQRTRWDQGFIQVLRKRAWTQLPTRRQRLLARYLLGFPLLQAMSGFLLPIAIAMAVFVKLPLSLALVAFLPLVGVAISVVIEMVALHELCRTFCLRPRSIDYVMLIFTAIPYQFVLAVAAVLAASREFRGDYSWEKTAHVGAHRGMPSTTLQPELT